MFSYEREREKKSERQVIKLKSKSTDVLFVGTEHDLQYNNTYNTI